MDKMNVDLTPELTHISLCTGYGGIDLGLKRALQKIRTICYVEIEAFVILNLVKKIEAQLLDVAPVFTDLKRFPWEQFAGRVDILSGGFPCQPFSAAGRREGDEDPRHLWPYITDGIKRLGRPSLVLFENVEGILSSKLKGEGWSDPEGTPVLQHVLREMERLGYEATAGVFSAREVGAPHQRKRVFIMGVRSDLGQSGRDIVSGMLRDTEAGVELVDSCYNGWEGRRAFVPEKRGSLDRGGQGVQRKRDASDADAEDASRSDGRITEQQGLCVSFRESSTAYPAPRGAEQFIWEPPRTTELGNTDSGNKRSHGEQPRILSQTICDREAGGPQRSSVIEHLGKTLSEGREGFRVTEREKSSQRWKTENRQCTYPSVRSAGLQRETESEVGRDADGSARWVDYAQLCESLDNRTDELRMLGNGVVPGTAERAFRVLWDALEHTSRESER